MKRLATYLLRGAITVWLAAKHLVTRRRLVVLLPLVLVGCTYTRLEYGGAVYEAHAPAWQVKQIKSIEVGYNERGLPVFRLNGYLKDELNGFKEVNGIVESATRGAVNGALGGK